jgi:hypothetical protein
MRHEWRQGRFAIRLRVDDIANSSEVSGVADISHESNRFGAPIPPDIRRLPDGVVPLESNSPSTMVVHQMPRKPVHDPDSTRRRAIPLIDPRLIADLLSDAGS